MLTSNVISKFSYFETEAVVANPNYYYVCLFV